MTIFDMLAIKGYAQSTNEAVINDLSNPMKFEYLVDAGPRSQTSYFSFEPKLRRIEQWLYDNVNINDWDRALTEDNLNCARFYYFKHKEDAIAFKLLFGDDNL